MYVPAEAPMSRAISANVRRLIVTHELGHVLGLGDYGVQCPSDAPIDDSAMAYQLDEVGNAQDCYAATPQDRDLNDVSAIYSPSPRERMELSPVSLPGVRGDARELIGGIPPRYTYIDDDTGKVSYFFVDNAYGYLVYRRDAHSHDPPDFTRTDTKVITPDMLNDGNTGYRTIFRSTEDPRTYEFVVVGITRGDPKRNRTLRGSTRHSTVHIPVSVFAIPGVTAELVGGVRAIEWTLGEPAILRWPFDGDTVSAVPRPDTGRSSS